MELEFGKGEGDSKEEVEYEKAKEDDLLEDSASANEEDLVKKGRYRKPKIPGRETDSEDSE